MTVKLQFIGDLSLNGLYNDPQNHQPLRENMRWLRSVLGDVDFRIVNWESPIWGDGGINELKSPRLATTENAARQVLPLDLNLALLANNHYFDCREEGVQNTLRFLHANGIDTVGVDSSREPAEKPYFREIKGLRFVFLNYLGPETHPNVPAGANCYANMLIPAEVEKDIKTYSSECDHLVVMPHWGTYERVRYPEPWQRDMARRWIDLGARLVVGTHAHCLQGWERYGKGVIVYSLGDFLFSPVSRLGCYTALHDSISDEIAVLDVEFDQDGIVKTDHRFFRREFESLLIRADDRSCRKKALKRISSALRLSDRALEKALQRDRYCSKIREAYRRFGVRQLMNTFELLLKKAQRHRP